MDETKQIILKEKIECFYDDKTIDELLSCYICAEFNFCAVILLDCECVQKICLCCLKRLNFECPICKTETEWRKDSEIEDYLKQNEYLESDIIVCERCKFMSCMCSVVEIKEEYSYENGYYSDRYDLYSSEEDPEEFWREFERTSSRTVVKNKIKPRLRISGKNGRNCPTVNMGFKLDKKR